MVSLVPSPTSSRRGDTLVEVMFSITVFALIAVISINLMNSGVNTAQASLEITMARNEIDAQAEALRFIQNSYLAERELVEDARQFDVLWRAITDRTGQDSSNSPRIVESFTNISNCTEAYTDMLGDNVNFFILNTRLIQPKFLSYDSMLYDDTFISNIIVSANAGDRLQPPSLFPRIIYGNGSTDNEIGIQESVQFRTIVRAEGIWIITVLSNDAADHKPPEFYDFYIRACWHAPGRNVPSTIGTVVRLYNPEVIE